MEPAQKRQFHHPGYDGTGAKRWFHHPGCDGTGAKYRFHHQRHDRTSFKHRFHHPGCHETSAKYRIQLQENLHLKEGASEACDINITIRAYHWSHGIPSPAPSQSGQVHVPARVPAFRSLPLQPFPCHCVDVTCMGLSCYNI